MVCAQLAESTYQNINEKTRNLSYSAKSKSPDEIAETERLGCFDHPKQVKFLKYIEWFNCLACLEHPKHIVNGYSLEHSNTSEHSDTLNHLELSSGTKHLSGTCPRAGHFSRLPWELPHPLECLQRYLSSSFRIQFN